MANRIEDALTELHDAVTSNPDHIYSDAFGVTLECLSTLAAHIKPEHRWLLPSQLADLQDMAHVATVVAPQKS